MPTQHATDQQPITFAELGIGPIVTFNRTPPINHNLVIDAISINTQAAHDLIGNTRVDFALGNTTPTSQAQFATLQRIFPATKGADLLQAGFWQPVRSERNYWNLNKTIAPQGRSIIALIRSIASLGPLVAASSVFVILTVHEVP